MQAHALELAATLLEEIELSSTSVSQQVKKAARLARIVGDTDATSWLRYEINGVPNDEYGRRHMTRTQRWIDREKDQGWWGPIADAEATINARERQLAASQVASFSGDMSLPASNAHRATLAALASIIENQARIVNRVAGLLHDFVAGTYYELTFSAEQRSLFDRARGEIDALLGPVSGNSLEQVDSIYRRLSEGDREAVSQAMTTCRRLIDEFADAVYPPQREAIERDGQTIDVGPNRTKNRINEYFAEKVSSASRRQRVRRSLADVYERVSAAVHDEVTVDEARFLFLTTYTLLGEILTAGPAKSS
jgi:hypothetical protein